MGFQSLSVIVIVVNPKWATQSVIVIICWCASWMKNKHERREVARNEEGNREVASKANRTMNCLMVLADWYRAT